MTTWINKEPGQEVGIVQEDTVLELFSLNAPDWIRTPPDLGSRQLRCKEVLLEKCVVKDHDHQARHYLMEEYVRCCECVVNQQFYWYKVKD